MVKTQFVEKNKNKRKEDKQDIFFNFNKKISLFRKIQRNTTLLLLILKFILKHNNAERTAILTNDSKEDTDKKPVTNKVLYFFEC